MNCDLFIEKLPELIENELDEQDVHNMFEHIKYCKCCRDEFKLMMKFGEEMKSSFTDNNLNYKSRKNYIMSSIDKNKYKKAKHKLTYKVSIAILAASIVVVIGWNSFNKYDSNKESLVNKENNISDTTSPNIASNFSINENDGVVNKDKNININDTTSPSITSNFSMSENNTNIKKPKVIEPQNGDKDKNYESRAITINIDMDVNREIKSKIQKNGDSLEPLKNVILKQSKQWVGPPRIEYMNDNVMIVTIANFIGAYSFKENAYYSIMDLRALNIGGYQGSQTYGVKYINDRFIAMGTTGEKETDNKPIYIIDLIDEKTIEVKDFSFNNSKLRVDVTPDTIIIAKRDFSRIIRLNYKEGKYTEVKGTIELSDDYSADELENNGFVKESIYKNKEMYPTLKNDDKLIGLYKNYLYVKRSDGIYVISKDRDDLLVKTSGDIKQINTSNDDEKIVIEKEKESIIINKKTLKTVKYNNDIQKVLGVYYSPSGNYRILYNDKVIVQSIGGMNKELNDMKDYVLESKITDDGKVIYVTLDEDLGVKVNIKDVN